MKVIGIASDHAGFELKSVVIGYLESMDYSVKDYGCYSCDSVDYPALQNMTDSEHTIDKRRGWPHRQSSVR